MTLPFSLLPSQPSHGPAVVMAMILHADSHGCFVAAVPDIVLPALWKKGSMSSRRAVNGRIDTGTGRIDKTLEQLQPSCFSAMTKRLRY